MTGWRHWPDPGRVDLPCDLGCNSVLMPGPAGREDEAAAVAIVEAVRRCAPWCQVFTAPWVKVDDEELGGVHVVRDSIQTVAIGTQQGVRNALRVSHHEIWHAAEWKMSEDAVGAVDALARKGRVWPGDYLSAPTERRARLYEGWASARDEGWSPACRDGTSTPIMRADQVMDLVYSGRFARALAESETKKDRQRQQREAIDKLGRRLRALVRL